MESLVGEKTVERAQRRATKLVHIRFQHVDSDRLNELRLPILQYKRLRYEMLKVYKILNCIGNLENIEQN